MSFDRIGNPKDVQFAVDNVLYVFSDGRPCMKGVDGAGFALFPVEQVDARSLQQAQAIVNQMFPQTGGTMGDYYDGEWVGPGSPNPGHTGPAAPPGGWCFQTINGKLTAIACNQVSNNSPQGTLLSSSDVRSIQSRLNAVIKAGLSVDGVYGPKTTAAVKTFQSLNGLSATGIMDAATRQKLFSAPQTTATPTGNAGAQIINTPPPNSNFSLSSLFSGMDTTTVLLLCGVAVVAIATRD